MRLPKISLLPAMMLFALSFTSCTEDCRDGEFDIKSVELEARRWFPGEGIGETEPWVNEDELPLVVLKVEIKMDKVFGTLPDFEGDCFPKYLIRNKVIDVKIFSNQSFNNLGPQQDLSSIILFSPIASTQLDQFITKNEWIDLYVNESNFSRSYFVFNQNPELEALHKIKMRFEFEDGSTLESNEIEVLLKRATLRE
jgi:hypothetical protein